MAILHKLCAYLVIPYAILTLSLHLLSYFLPSRYTWYTSSFARALCYVFGIIVCASYGVVVSVPLSLIGQAGLIQWTVAKSFKWLMWPLTGVWFDIDDPHGELDQRPVVFLANHQTELDILMLGHVWPKYTSVTSKSSLKWYPFLGWFSISTHSPCECKSSVLIQPGGIVYLSNTVFINRANSASAIATFSSAADKLRNRRQNVLLFPEGTRSYFSSPDLLPFKKGGFHLAVQAQVPIVPVVCANYGHIIDFKRLKFASGRIPVRVLKSIDTTGLTSEHVPDLVERVRNDMIEALKEMHAKPTPANLQKTNGYSAATGTQLAHESKTT